MSGLNIAVRNLDVSSQAEAVSAPALKLVSEAEEQDENITIKYYLGIVEAVMQKINSEEFSSESIQQYAITRGKEMQGLHQSLLSMSVKDSGNENVQAYLKPGFGLLIQGTADYLALGEVTLGALASIKSQIHAIDV